MNNLRKEKREESLHWLGFDYNANPSQEEIKKAWKSQAKKYHPDISNLDKIDAEECFRKVLESYKFLSNDTSIEEEFQVFKEDLVKRARKNFTFEIKINPALRDIEPKVLHLGTITLSIFYFLFREEKYSFDITVSKPCPDCTTDEKTWITCKICDQTGEKLETDLFSVKKMKCKQCKGNGWIRKTFCDRCKNAMRINTTKNISISVPENYNLGSVITLPGLGNIGTNKVGSITLALRPKIPKFSRIDHSELYDLLKSEEGKC